jgi:uncharacterized protein with von Willebrand factor type A (vWA) domain
MIEKLEEFCCLLRKNSVRVSVGEVLDATRVAQVVGLSSPGDLRAALRATLVKKVGDQRTFDELFSLYFLRGADLARDLYGTPVAELLFDLGLTEDDIERIVAILGDQAAQMSQAARSSLGLRAMDVTPLLRLAGTELEHTRITSPLQVGYHTHRLLSAMNVPEAERELERVAALVARALGEAQAQALRKALALNLAALRQAIRRHVQEEFEKQNIDWLAELRGRTLSQKPFSQLAPEELVRLRSEVSRLARKLRAQASLRPKIERRGRLDARRTVRRSLRTGGIPFELKRRRRRVERPRLVVLCDISDSVRNVSRFFLELVYTLQELFDRVRSFVFVSDLGETTDLFRSCDIDRAVDLAYRGAVIHVHSNSNYGRALEIFSARYADAVTGKTTVIVIGDARNNYNPPNADRLSELRRRAKRVLWLNPEPPAAWGFGDSAMRDYEPYCDRVELAHNLDSLRKVIDELVL